MNPERVHCISRRQNGTFLTVNAVSHWAARDLQCGVEMPEDSAVFGVGRYDRSRTIAKENDAPGGSHQAAPQRVRANLRDLPHDLACLDVDGPGGIFHSHRWENDALSSLIKRFAEFEGIVILVKDPAGLGGEDEELAGLAD